MHILESRQTISCPPPPPCACGPNEECHQIGRTTTTCATFTCVPKPTTNTSSHSGGVSSGALAGAIVVALIFLAGAVCLFLWYRKHQRLQAAAQRTTFETKPDIPASADTVLRRPNPTEKPAPPTEFSSVRRYSNTNINLDPQSYTNAPRPPSAASNPFTDSHSIQTAGTEGTNVIPIALVSPDPEAPATSLSRSTSATGGPTRPVRSPDLNLEHANVSEDSVPHLQAKYAPSQISGITNRTSYMSSASYGSEFLNEAPMIITPTQGTFRQVLGVVKAEVINAPTSESLRPPTMSSAKRPSVSSPLAAGSYGPGDISGDSSDGHDDDADPFSDKHTSTATNLAASPSASVTTFGQVSAVAPRGDWPADSPTLPWMRRDDQSRPSSMSTQAGSVIVGIENATRVNLGLSQLSHEATDSGSPRSPYRTTMGRLVTPDTAGLGVLEEQQRKALAHAQLRAQEQGLDRRVSNSSVMSTSTKADSILESFPFVPPSPISNRPARSPPVSPLAQQTFSVTPASPLASPSANSSFRKDKDDDDLDLPKPPSRHTLGLSTASQFSTASTGLGSFPFQIDSGAPSEPSAAFPGRQRASLDTLALTNDLSSYPLGVERDSGVLPYE